MMPENDPSTPTPAEGPAAPTARPTTVSTKPTLQDLFTGGWKRPLSGLPTALGRPLTHWAAAGRSRLGALGHSAPGGTVPR